MGLFSKRREANGCIYCGQPLSGDHDGWAHAACERVVAADDAANKVIDNSPLEQVERRLRVQERCPWQMRPHGWDGSAIYCGREITNTGGDDEDLFCLEHQCEYYGDDEGAAQERWERTEQLLEQGAF
jgi:hypothetical protein